MLYKSKYHKKAATVSKKWLSFSKFPEYKSVVLVHSSCKIQVDLSSSEIEIEAL